MTRSPVAGKVCHGQCLICRFRIGDDGSILRSQESQPYAHFFLIVFDDGLKQCDQGLRSLRVLFYPDLSAEPANQLQLDVIHGDVTLACLQTRLAGNPERKYSHNAFLQGIREKLYWRS